MFLWFISPSTQKMTSSTHRSTGILTSDVRGKPISVANVFSARRSIILEKRRPVNLEPCRPPTSISNSCVRPCFVLTTTFRLVFIFLRIRHAFPFIPLSQIVFSMSSLSALSYALKTSMKVKNVAFLSCLDRSIMALRMRRWSHVEDPLFPPPWACVKGMRASIRWSISVSRMVPMDEEVVIPLWLFNFSLSPFPFQILVICPRFHEVGISSSSQIVLING